jgi:hypothetical protein
VLLLEKGIVVSNILLYMTWYYAEDFVVEMVDGLSNWIGSDSTMKQTEK